MSLVEICGHATYLLLAMSYLVRDIVWLRAISIPASVCSILFNYFAPAEPLWLIINWNLFFLFVNSVQITWTRLEGRSARLSTEMTKFAALVSPRLTMAQATKLFKQSQRREIDGPTILIEEGTLAGELILILEGTVEISKDAESIGECGPGTFLGEISFLTSEPHSATVSVAANETVVFLHWDQMRLTTFAKSRPEFHIALQSCLAANLSRKFVEREIPIREATLSEPMIR